MQKRISRILSAAVSLAILGAAAAAPLPSVRLERHSGDRGLGCDAGQPGK